MIYDWKGYSIGFKVKKTDSWITAFRDLPLDERINRRESAKYCWDYLTKRAELREKELCGYMALWQLWRTYGLA